MHVDHDDGDDCNDDDDAAHNANAAQSCVLVRKNE